MNLIMAFQRANWHSGLTYQQTCENCKTTFRYTDYSLDFRPWFPDGYVDCPRCGSHTRHNERFAIDSPNAAVNPQEVPADDVAAGRAAFCVSCGKAFGEKDCFCSQCGAKRN